MEVKQKILLCGDVEGRFQTLFKRVEAINAKSGPFDMLLCVGNFFGVNNVEFEDYKTCAKQVCIPTYILGPNKEEHLEYYPEDVAELCPNVHYLGKKGIYYSSGGLKIAYLSGVPNDDPKAQLKPYEFNKTDIVSLRDTCLKSNPNFRGVDLLLTSPWPKNVTNLDPTVKLPEVPVGSELVSWLAAELKPRYHAVGLDGVYYERPPYRNYDAHGEPRGEIATRFIAMARVGNPVKAKWIYALNLTPVDRIRLKDLYQRTVDETACPYDGQLLAQASGKSAQVQQYFYNMDASDDKRKRHYDNDNNRRKKSKPVFDQAKCWFCLASPEVEKHLVISVGDEVYLALAKGGLVDEHLLILPVEHHQSLLNLPESVLNEITRFKAALIKYFNESDKVPVFFERNFKTSHLQIQVVPVPRQAMKELADIFKDEAEGNGIKLDELPAHNRLDQVIPTGAPYFCVELPDVTLYTRCRAGFPLQFGREVLATGPVLNMVDRVEWKDCIKPRAEEDVLVQRMRKDFEPFDFTV